MKKIVVIDRCSDCPYMDNEYYMYNRTCVSLDKKIPDSFNIYSEIYPECPLKDLKDETE